MKWVIIPAMTLLITIACRLAAFSQSPNYSPTAACVLIGTCKGSGEGAVPKRPERDCAEATAERDGPLFEEFDRARRQYSAAIQAQSDIDEAITDLAQATRAASYADLGLTVAHVAKVASGTILALSGEGAGISTVKAGATAANLATATSEEESSFTALMAPMGRIGEALTFINDGAVAIHDISSSRSNLASLRAQLTQMKSLLRKYQNATSIYSATLNDANAKREAINDACGR